MNRFALLVMGLTLVPTFATAQPLAVPDVGPAGVGVFFHRTDRDFEQSNGDQFSADWSRRGLAIYGTVAHRAVFMATGSYEPPGADPDFPGRVYQALGIGAGITLYPLVEGAYRIGVSLRYYRHIWQDQSIQRYDKVVDGTTVALQAERGFKLRSVDALVWIAPAYVGDRLYSYPGVDAGSEDASSTNIGAIAGTSLVLWRHVSPYVQFAVVEHLQTQAGVSYIF